LRVGGWRVHFAYDYPAQTLHVLRVLPPWPTFRD
jgi:hypothetical protein